MSEPENQAQTPANSAVRNTAGKGSKQTPNSNLGYLLTDKLREICEKHYNQILPIMAEKVHQEKLQEKGDLKREGQVRSLRQGAHAPRRTQVPSLEGEKPTRRRSSVNAIVFTRLGPRDRNVFTRERQREIEEEWDAADRASHRSPAQTKELCFSKNDHDQGGHCKSKKHRPNYEDDLSQPWLCEETNPFIARIQNLEVPKKTHMPTNVKTYDGTRDLEDHLKMFQAAEKIERCAMPTWCHMFNSMLIGSVIV
ncbi:hypothetical protein Tco_1182526 [Tanacetum coccineum]